MMKKVNMTLKCKICYLFACVVLSGCGMKDSAITIPIGDSEADIGATEGTQQADNRSEHDTQTVICVYVCGAVVNPGVVELPEGSRADDALREAGGFSENAQKDYVNLAAKVEDGEKLYFPSVEEAGQWHYTEELEQKGLVNINTADISMLTTLPGIGEARAGDIIAYREEHGDFQKIEDLQKVSGIKGSVFEKLRDKIVVE